ncbi:MAG: cadherin-like domain-containing protein [Burkholderiaceae bacterium]
MVVEDTSTVIDLALERYGYREFDPLQIIDFTPASNGTVTYTGDGTLTYSPVTNFNGGDNFEYMIADSGLGLTHFWDSMATE